MLPLVLSSDSHVFEPPDLWQTRIDRAFRDRAPRIERMTAPTKSWSRDQACSITCSPRTKTFGSSGA